MDTHEQAGPEVLNAEVVGEKKCWFERAKSVVTGVRISTVKTVLVAAVGVGILATEA